MSEQSASSVVITMLLLLGLACVMRFSEAFDFFQNDYVIEFERVELVSFKKEYFGDTRVVTWKFNRTQPVVNLTTILKVDFENNLEVIVQGYKFLSNEYREFPMRFQFNVCKGIKENMFGLASIYDHGNFSKCPLKKGNYHVFKWVPDSSKFPPHFPSGQFMWMFEFMYLENLIAEIKSYCSINRPIVPKY